MKRVSLSLFGCMSLMQLMAQVNAWPAGNIPLAITDHLNGPNVSITNVISQVIDPLQVGFFSDSTASIGLDGGLVISTGVCYGVIGPNNIPNMTLGGGAFNSDADLITMSPIYSNTIGDPAIVQMDLMPAGDTLSIRYVFGSEEYDEYTCSDKDDRLGMFLSGPGIVGPFSNGAINMATLPISGLPVTVNTVNRGVSGSEGSTGLCFINPTWQQDTIYYINNDFGLGTQLDGYTVVLTARAVVIPGSIYHLKLAIADVNDANFDSAVFLPEGAISCNELSTGIGVAGSSIPCPWLSALDHVINIHGLSPEAGMVMVEAFDPAGRLLQRSQALPNGAFHGMTVDPGYSGLVVLRIRQGDHVMTGRVLLR